MAIACEHVPAAWQAANRWRTLAPDDVGANTLYAVVALKLYRTSDARDAIRAIRLAVERDSAPQAQPPGAAAAAGAARPRKGAARDPLAANMTELAALLLEEADAPGVLAAMSGALDGPPAPSAATLLLLGELALTAYDGPRAESYARQVLAKNDKDLGALHVLARACLLQGRSAEAIATARGLRWPSIPSTAGWSSLKFSPRSIATRKPARNSSSCARKARPRPKSTGGWRCSLSIPAI